MNGEVALVDLYYRLKPFIPRRLQIAIRRNIALRKRTRYRNEWPIDEAAGRVPEGWSGWPEGKRFALVLTHDVDTHRGMNRCLPLMEIEKQLGFRSSFYFVPERYPVRFDVLQTLNREGFEVGLHGLDHNGNLFRDRKIFRDKAKRINRYLREWGSVGFRSPCMFHNLDWIHDLDVRYDASTFDTDPFEPQPDGVGTIFPFWVPRDGGTQGYIELPYTLPQDFTLFVLMGETSIDIWKRKLDWIAGKGGMALLNTHPDYMVFEGRKPGREEYPIRYYSELLEHVRCRFKDAYYHSLPRDLAEWFRRNRPGGPDHPSRLGRYGYDVPA